MELLPNDMIVTVMENLLPMEVVKITIVCKKWLLLIRNSVRLYKKFISSKLPLPKELDMLQEFRKKYYLSSFTPNPSYFELTNNARMTTRLHTSGWQGIFAQKELKKGSKISFKISSPFARIGLAPKEVNQSLDNHFDRPGGGWYLYCADGKICCKYLRFFNKPYYNQQIPANSVVSVELRESGEIVFYFNGCPLGVAFSNVTQPVIPAVLLPYKNDFVEIVANP